MLSYAAYKVFLIIIYLFFLFQGPVEVSGLQKEIALISAGYYHSCAITGMGLGMYSCGIS